MNEKEKLATYGLSITMIALAMVLCMVLPIVVSSVVSISMGFLFLAIGFIAGCAYTILMHMIFSMTNRVHSPIPPSPINTEHDDKPEAMK